MTMIQDLGLKYEPWMAEGVCGQTDPEAFFPERGGSNREAKRVCKTSCPVREECLEFAVANDEPFGVWGGLSERERRPLVAARLKAAETGTTDEAA